MRLKILIKKYIQLYKCRYYSIYITGINTISTIINFYLKMTLGSLENKLTVIGKGRDCLTLLEKE